MIPDVKPGDGSVEKDDHEPWGVEEIISSTRAMVPLIVSLIILLKLVVRCCLSARTNRVFFLPKTSIVAPSTWPRHQDRVMCDVPKESRFKFIQFKAST